MEKPELKKTALYFVGLIILIFAPIYLASNFYGEEALGIVTQRWIPLVLIAAMFFGMSQKVDIELGD